MQRKFALRAIPAALGFGAFSVYAAAPAYVATSLGAAQTTFNEYLDIAVPIILAVVASLAALGLLIRLTKKVFSGG